MEMPLGFGTERWAKRGGGWEASRQQRGGLHGGLHTSTEEEEEGDDDEEEEGAAELATATFLRVWSWGNNAGCGSRTITDGEFSYYSVLFKRALGLFLGFIR